LRANIRRGSIALWRQRAVAARVRVQALRRDFGGGGEGSVFVPAVAETVDLSPTTNTFAVRAAC
jgi:hypothetical protein